MKIERYYKEMNEITDISGDYVKVTMTSEQWYIMRMLIECPKTMYKYKKPMIKAIKKAETKEEWY